MEKIKKLLTISVIVSQVAISASEDFIPKKPTIASDCSEKSAEINSYVANVHYLKLLNQFIQELQTLIRKQQAIIEQLRDKIYNTQGRIKILRLQSEQKKNAIKTLQADINALLNSEKQTFKYLNNAVCLYHGAKTIAISSALVKLVKEKKLPIAKNYFKYAATLSTSIFSLVNICQTSIKNQVDSEQTIQKNIKTLENLNTIYTPPGAKMEIKQEELSKQAAKIFATIQRRLLNAYILISQGKTTDNPFDGITVPQTFDVPQATLENLTKNALSFIDPKSFNDTISAFRSRLDKFLPAKKQDWSRAIKLYKFGLTNCDCQKQCEKITDKTSCVQECEARGKKLFSYAQRDCEKECGLLENPRKEICVGDIAEACNAAYEKTKTKCKATCTANNKQKQEDWDNCVNLSETLRKTCHWDGSKEDEICQRFQPLGIADIQSEIDILQKQIVKLKDSEQPTENNIPAKIERAMSKIDKAKSIIETAKVAITTTQTAITSIDIAKQLPTDNKAKSTCANQLQALIKHDIDLNPAKMSAQQLASYLEKTYGSE